jgi:nitroreductase
MKSDKSVQKENPGKPIHSFLDMILSRHSIREYTGESIDDESLKTLVRAGMAAPSAVNVQPWSFIIIKDKKTLLNLREKLPYAKMLNTAAAAIVVCGVTDKDEVFAKNHWMLDCSAATENILLAAHALSYGAVWTAVYPDTERVKTVCDECKIPSNVIPLCVIPIGIPLKINSKPIDKFDEGNIHWNAW